MKYSKTHWLQACLDPEAQVSFSLTLFSASSLSAPISDGLSDSGDKMNRKQLFPLANFLGSLLCHRAVHQTTVGIIPFLYSSTEKFKKWTNSQYIIHNDWLLQHWGKLGQHKNSTGLCLLSKLPVIHAQPHPAKKMTTFTLETFTQLLPLLPSSDTKCLLVGLALETCHFNGRICQRGWYRLGETVAL